MARGVEFIEVDGSHGEGGGQILRIAVAFSAILGRPVHVSKVRAGRAEPGLKKQHMWALRALGEVFGGELTGVQEGSTEVTFVPGKTRRTVLTVDLQTAASITLVLQAVVPAVALSGNSLKLELVGGTDVPWSPTFDYLAEVVKPAYSSMGISFEVRAPQRGYYPVGGGRVTAEVLPSEGVRAIDMTKLNGVPAPRVTSRCASLPTHVAQRQADACVEYLSREGLAPSEVDVIDEKSRSPGSSILAWSVGGGAFMGADSLGARGLPAEEVGQKAARQYVEASRSGACVDANLGDMIVPLLSMADGESTVTVPRITSHLESGLALAKLFTSCSYSTEDLGSKVLVRVNPS